MARALYNEIDPYAAQWLRNLIAAGHIAPGDVDERSIDELVAADLRGYTQVHFFAGIGVWSYALRLAGWPDDRPVWTGSCPCQPFSSAGKGKGFADERHLWPAFFHLIQQCRPPVVFGEQVASKDGLEWLDLVQADLERSGYASAAVDLCAAGVGAPHIRQRLYWVADTDSTSQGMVRNSDCGLVGWSPADAWVGSGSSGSAGGVANNNNNKGLEGWRQPECERGTECAAGSDSVAGGLANADLSITEQPSGRGARPGKTLVAGPHGELDGRGELVEGQPAARPTHGFWADADWLFCRDGKWRPVEPGTFPLAHGATARVGRLRAYGNAIVPQVAQAFIAAYLEC